MAAVFGLLNSPEQRLMVTPVQATERGQPKRRHPSTIATHCMPRSFMKSGSPIAPYARDDILSCLLTAASENALNVAQRYLEVTEADSQPASKTHLPQQPEGYPLPRGSHSRLPNPMKN